MEAAKVTTTVQEEAVQIAKRIVMVKATLDANKPLYEELDKLTLKLNALLGTTQIPVVLSEEERMFLHNGETRFVAPNQIVSIVDNFSERNTVFRPAGVKRFEATSETMEEYLAKKEKADKKKSK